jgi:hypothetical protein
MDHQLQRLCRLDHRGNADPIYIDYFLDTGIGYDYAGSGLAYTSIVTDHVGNLSVPSSLSGEETQQHRLD